MTYYKIHIYAESIPQYHGISIQKGICSQYHVMVIPSISIRWEYNLKPDFPLFFWCVTTSGYLTRELGYHHFMKFASDHQIFRWAIKVRSLQRLCLLDGNIGKSILIPSTSGFLKWGYLYNVRPPFDI